MTCYLLVKWVHILSSTVLFGTGAGIAFFFVRAQRTGDPKVVAAVAGDVAMLASEVTPVLKVLRQNNIDVVAIHHHMTGTNPTIYFLHYWGTGPADKLARAFKAALGELGRTAKQSAAKN